MSPCGRDARLAVEEASSHSSASGNSRERKGQPSSGEGLRQDQVKSSLLWEHVASVSPVVCGMDGSYPLGRSLAFQKHLRHRRLYSLGGADVFSGWPYTHTMLRSCCLWPCANPQIRKSRSSGSVLETSRNGTELVVDVCVSLLLNSHA